MSTPFTDITTVGANVFSVNVSNEIITAYNEHKIILGDVPTSLFVVGGDAHWRNDWENIQRWIINNATTWIDYTQEAGGNFNGKIDFPHFTLNSFYIAAGIPLGFRRATSWDYSTDDWTDYNDPMYSYGEIQVGDIFGPWIFEDLEAALSIPKWTGQEISMSGEITRKDRIVNYIVGRANAVTLWNATTWTNTAPTFQTSYIAACYESSFRPGFNDLWTIERLKSDPINITTGIISLSSSIDVYVRLQTPGVLQFLDIDSYGCSNDQIAITETIAASNTASRTISSIANFDVNPDGIITFPPATNTGQGYFINRLELCWKWNLTYG